MLIGSGFIAKALMPLSVEHEDICFYAAGVSDSLCRDDTEFLRERVRLSEALQRTQDFNRFLYFSTCSIDDPDLCETPYVRHKHAMERLVRTHPAHLILRLPQMAGFSSNPHTLLNFLYARISRGEHFQLWKNAGRNILDIADMVAIVGCLSKKEELRNATRNIAALKHYSVAEIVREMELAAGKSARYDAVEQGSACLIDVSAIFPILDELGIEFPEDYLRRVIRTYYGAHVTQRARPQPITA